MLVLLLQRMRVTLKNATNQLFCLNAGYKASGNIFLNHKVPFLQHYRCFSGLSRAEFERLKVLLIVVIIVHLVKLKLSCALDFSYMEVDAAM